MPIARNAVLFDHLECNVVLYAAFYPVNLHVYGMCTVRDVVFLACSKSCCHHDFCRSRIYALKRAAMAAWKWMLLTFLKPCAKARERHSTRVIRIVSISFDHLTILSSFHNAHSCFNTAQNHESRKILNLTPVILHCWSIFSEARIVFPGGRERENWFFYSRCRWWYFQLCSDKVSVEPLPHFAGRPSKTEGKLEAPNLINKMEWGKMKK